VSKGTLYLYFNSKEDIFDALIRAIPQANIEQARAIAADPSVPAIDLLARVLRFVGHMIRDPRMTKFPRLIIGEAGNFPNLAETYKREVISRGVGLLATIIERGIEDGTLRPVVAKHAAYAAIAPLLFTAIWRTTFERFDAEPLDADAFVDQHIDSFLRGLKAEAAQ
jgi:AcrR family transcriptional regulator